MRTITKVSPFCPAYDVGVLNLPGQRRDHRFHRVICSAAVVPPVTTEVYVSQCDPTGLFDGERIRAAVVVRRFGDNNPTRDLSWQRNWAHWSRRGVIYYAAVDGGYSPHVHCSEEKDYHARVIWLLQKLSLTGNRILPCRLSDVMLDRPFNLCCGLAFFSILGYDGYHKARIRAHNTLFVPWEQRIILYPILPQGRRHLFVPIEGEYRGTTYSFLHLFVCSYPDRLLIHDTPPISWR